MDKININLDNTEFIEEAMPLLKDLEERDYDLRKQHNSSFLTFSWFLIATAWVIVSLNEVTTRTKYMLISSIISFVIWYICVFLHSELWINKFWKTIWDLLNWSNIKTIDEINEKINDINNVWKETKKEKKLKNFWVIFQNLWIILFIVWLIMFIISL